MPKHKAYTAASAVSCSPLCNISLRWSLLIMYNHECLEHTRRMNSQISILRSCFFLDIGAFLGVLFVCFHHGSRPQLDSTVIVFCPSSLTTAAVSHKRANYKLFIWVYFLKPFGGGGGIWQSFFIEYFFLKRSLLNHSVSMLTQELLAVCPVEIRAESGSRQSGRGRDGPHMSHPPVTLGHTVL